jgi:two-component system, cell cycle sensor histidine kinase and response regulator CckA
VTGLAHGAGWYRLWAMDRAPSPDPSGRQIVLVVDDEPLVRRLMAAALDVEFCVLIAADGREALEIVDSAETQVAAVVTDVRMPDIDGLTLARELHKRPHPPLILFVSGFSADNQIPGPLLTKPFHPEQLLATVRNLLAGLPEERRGSRRV